MKSRRRVEECRGIISALGSPGLGALISGPKIAPGGGSQGSDGLGVRVPPPLNTRGIPRSARAQDEDLEGGYRESHQSRHLLSAKGNSGGGMSSGSQGHWRLDVSREASAIGGVILRF